MALTVGTRLKSTTDETEVIVVRCTQPEVDLRCGGHPMSQGDASERTTTPLAGFDGGSAIGKRYVDEEAGLELLCVRPGAGSLSVGDRLLGLKSAKALPASD